MWKLQYCQCYLGLLLLVMSIWMPCNGSIASKNASLVGNARPLVVNVGALFAFDSTIGRVAKTAMELAVKNVNSDYSLLGGTKLEFSMMDGL